MTDLKVEHTKSSTFDPVQTLENQALEEDTDRVTDAILYVHHHEQPVIVLREIWASHAADDPRNGNPHRWWNDSREMPNRVLNDPT